ncbi:MAG: hypothetical protein HY834_08990 [Devosia nanyangense]|uniref:Uncharacterized protein n=1 Tax=Devosia nanyangense TaxID=1228055 RepID=A0A933L2A2_9HYPH|nr:hypothetical protein [Devosia nanyangense]
MSNLVGVAYWAWNYCWSLDDIDRVEQMMARGEHPSAIARAFRTTTEEVERLIARNPGLGGGA